LPPGSKSCWRPHRDDLARLPLYVTLDKDVMTASDAVVNWDSGLLRLEEVETILHVVRDLAAGPLAGMDIVGDWSEVRVEGWFRAWWHWTEHPKLQVDPVLAWPAQRDRQPGPAFLS